MIAIKDLTLSSADMADVAGGLLPTRPRLAPVKFEISQVSLIGVNFGAAIELGANFHVGNRFRVAFPHG